MEPLVFSTVVRDGTVTGLGYFFGTPDIDLDNFSQRIEIMWQVTPDTISDELIEMKVCITSVQAIIEWKYSLDTLNERQRSVLMGNGAIESGDSGRGETMINSNKVIHDKIWKIDQRYLTFDQNGGISINGAEIDFQTMKITLS